MAADIDLSKAGKFVFDFNQTCSACCQERIVLLVPAAELAVRPREELLTGLIAELEIANAKGEPILETDSEWTSGMGSEGGDEIPLFDFRPFRKGHFRATITVVAGAPALEGVTQRAEGRYLLCGVERMIGYFGLALGGGAILLGGIVVWVVWGGMNRPQGKRPTDVGKLGLNGGSGSG